MNYNQQKTITNNAMLSSIPMELQNLNNFYPNSTKLRFYKKKKYKNYDCYDFFYLSQFDYTTVVVYLLFPSIETNH